LQSERKQAEHLCLGTARGERNANATGHFDDAACDLQEAQADGCELGVPQRIPARDGIAHVEQQPVGAGV
jgi:hypothetical protein